MPGLWFGCQTVMMLDGYDKGGTMYFEGPYGPEPVDWPEPVLEPSDDDLMTQYDNEIDEYTAEESWS